LIWFCQADLKGFRQGDWLNAHDSMYDFENFGDPHAPLHRGGFDIAVTFKSLIAFQPMVLKVLRKLAIDPQKQNSDEQYGPLIDAMVTVGAFGTDEPFEEITDSAMDLTVGGYLALYRHLVSSGIVRGQLRVCPQCQRIFLAKRRPRSDVTLHCSLRCSRLAATHRYRTRQKEQLKVKERERSHDRYVRKKRAKYPAVPVPRRPRKSQ
jgi:hypothetical protein